ncbi:MAG: FISUMP domain-containing protein [Bacteroidales bacterium]
MMSYFFKKRIVISITLQLVVGTFTFGQQYGQTTSSFQVPPFSVLWSNADLVNKKLFVEIMYDKQTCFSDAAEFWMYSKSHPPRRVKIDSLLNNQKNCIISSDSLVLSNPTAGGYRLRFALTSADTAVGDSAHIRVTSKYQTYFSCKGCGAAGSDVTVDSTSIHPDCPYKNPNFDLLACTKRTGGAKNWEGFMVDHRDCKIYRMVAMPHLSTYNNGQGRWWLAQNLNYTKNLINNPTVNVAPTSNVGAYYCPNGASFSGTPGVSVNELLNAPTNIDVACKTYGAIYGRPTIMSINGLSPTFVAFTGIGVYSSSQGICPLGWVLPGRKDWAVMYNKASGCTDNKAETAVERNSILEAPCHNFHNSEAGLGHDPTTLLNGVPLLFRNTLSDRKTVIDDSIFATATKPTWRWRAVGSKGHHAARPTDYYGFSVLPVGLANVYRYYAVGQATWIYTNTGTESQIETIKFGSNRLHYRIEVLGVADFGTPVRCVRAYNADL